MSVRELALHQATTLGHSHTRPPKQAGMPQRSHRLLHVHNEVDAGMIASSKWSYDVVCAPCPKNCVALGGDSRSRLLRSHCPEVLRAL